MLGVQRLVVGGIVLLAWTANGSQQSTFRSAVDTVSIYATVSDARGRLVPDLSQSDFEVLDEGKPAQVTVFSNEAQPITVAVMLDMSLSRAGTFLRIQEGMLEFVQALLPADRARIGTFGHEISISPLLTNSKPDLTRILNEELWPGGASPIWNAVDAAMSSLTGEPGRRVVLIHTDGDDSRNVPGRNVGYSEVSARATRESFLVYAISLPLLVNARSRTPAALGASLVTLTGDTGGGYINMKSTDDVATTFRQVADELRGQYLLGFRPAVLDGKSHRLDVRIKSSGFKVRTRKSYVAVRAQ